MYVYVCVDVRVDVSGYLLGVGGTMASSVLCCVVVLCCSAGRLFRTVEAFCARLCVCVCACVREREREREGMQTVKSVSFLPVIPSLNKARLGKTRQD